jgi:hypothetical protein
MGQQTTQVLEQQTLEVAEVLDSLVILELVGQESL